MLSKPPNATRSIPTAASTLSEFSTEADSSLAEALQGCNTKNQHRKQLQKYSSWQQGNPSSSSASSSWCSPTTLEHSCLQRAGGKEQTQCQTGFSPSSTEINHFSASSKPQPPYSPGLKADLKECLLTDCSLPQPFLIHISQPANHILQSYARDALD